MLNPCQLPDPAHRTSPIAVIEALQQRQEERLFESIRMEAETSRATAEGLERQRAFRMSTMLNRHDISRHLQAQHY